MRRRLNHLILAGVISACAAAFGFTASAGASSYSTAPSLEPIREVARPDGRSNDLDIPVLAAVRGADTGALSEVSTPGANRIRLAADLPVKAPPPSMPSCAGDFYFLPGTDTCISIPIKVGYNFPFWCFGDTGIGYTTSAYTNGLSGGDKSSGGDYSFKPGYSISTKDFRGWSVGGGYEFPGTGTFHDDKLDFSKYSFRPDYKWNLGYGSLDYQNYSNWTTPQTSGGTSNDNPRIGINYRFDDKPKTSEPTKVPSGGYIKITEYNGIKLGGYLRAENNPPTTFPGEGSYNWVGRDYRGGLNAWDGSQWGGSQVFIGTRQPVDGIGVGTGYRGTIDQPSWGPWDVIRDSHSGDTYEISYKYDDGTEERFSAFYDFDGNYHERWDFYDYEESGNDEQTDYVYDGTSMMLIGRTHTDWEWDAIYVHQQISSNGQVAHSWDRFSYFDLAIGLGPQPSATTLFQVQLAQLLVNLLSLPPSFMAPGVTHGGDPGLPLRVVPLAGDSGGSVDVVPIVGDLGEDVYLDMGGGSGGPASAPDANVKLQVEQAGPVPSNTGNPKRGDLETLRPIPVSLTSLEFAENAPARDGKAKTANPAPAPVEKPPVALKLFTNKPALPTTSGVRPPDVGFDQAPAACLIDKTGGCSVTVPSSERRFYGLIGDASDFAVKLKVPYTTAIIWREKDDAQPATIDAIRQRMPSLPPEVRAKARSFSIGDKKFSQAMIEASDFNPSPDRWKSYLRPTTPAPTPAPAGKMKRGDKDGSPTDSYASFAQGGGLGSALSDDCEVKQPAAYIEGQPLAVSDVQAHELPSATIHFEAVR